MTMHALRTRAVVRVAAVATAVFIGGTAFGISSGQAGTAPAESPASPAAAAASASSAVLPVLGRATITGSRDVAGARATALVHGVRRVPGGTVLYFSVGLPSGSTNTGWTGLSRISQARRYGVSSGSTLGTQFLVDMARKQVYSVLVDSERRALASPNTAWARTKSGQFYVLYQVLPELPADLTTIDVLVGNADVIHDVPISDGLMEPAVEQTNPLPLGQGWPKVDLAAVAASLDPAQSVHDLTVVTSDLEKTVVQREKKDSVSVDLAADVLFAVDSDTLTAAAKTKIQAAADQINERSAGGDIRVVGHTDDSGSSSYNDDLSKRRAQSVANVLKPLVTVAGATYKIEGRGEREPVADNDTSSGRQENRRVSVIFTPQEGK